MLGRKEKASETDDVFFNPSDASSDTESEEKSPAKEELSSEEDNRARVDAFIRAIEPALDEMKGTGKPLKYFKAQNRIRKLATYAPQKDQNAIEDFYFNMLEGCGNSIPSLKTFNSTLKWLIIAAESTEVEQEYLLTKIQKCIREIDVFETANNIKNPQADVYRRKLQSLSLNSELRTFHSNLKDVCENIKERRADFNRTPERSLSSESNRASRQPLSPLRRASVLRPLEMQRAKSEGASETDTPAPRRRLSFGSGSLSE